MEKIAYKSPHFKWADTKTDLYITVSIPDIEKKHTVSQLTPEGQLHMITNKIRKNKKDPPPDMYALDLELFGRVKVLVREHFWFKYIHSQTLILQESVYEVHDNKIVYKIRKLEPVKWKSLQRPGLPKLPNEKIDWDKVLSRRRCETHPL